MNNYFLLHHLIAFCSGIALGNFLPSSTPTTIIGSIFIATTLFVCHFFVSNARIIAMFFLAVTSACGLGLVQLQTINQQNNLAIIAGKHLTISGIIYEKHNLIGGRNKELCLLSLKQVINAATQEPLDLHGKLGLYLLQKTDFVVRDKICITDVAIRKEDKNNNNISDYAQYLKKEQLITTLFVDTKKISLTGRPSWSIRRWLWLQRERVYAGLRHKLSPRARAYFGLIFLGNKQQYDYNQLRTSFNVWGISHYLARSGLHMVIFVFLWGFALRLVPIHLRLKKIILALLAGCYALLSWGSISFTRALLLLALVEGGSFWKKQTVSLHLLSLICLTILLLNPAQLFFLDFQLTFLLTFGLLIFFSR